MNPQTFSHSGNIGDVWAALPTLKEYHKKTGRKVILYLVNGQSGKYYPGAIHPTKNDEGENVMLNIKMIDMMLPLLKAQPFIEDAKVLEDENVAIDLDEIRRSYVGMPHLPINRWYFYIFPDLACDVTKEWLTVPHTEKNFCKGKVLINRTERYTNDSIGYQFLEEYKNDCMFVGTQREWNNFCMQFGLNIRKLHVDTFLEYAQAIKQSRFYLSNQSQGFQLAQGMLHPRILEVCGWASNVIVHGEDAFDFTAQMGLEYYFDYLFNGKNPPTDGFMQKAEKAVINQ